MTTSGPRQPSGAAYCTCRQSTRCRAAARPSVSATRSKPAPCRTPMARERGARRQPAVERMARIARQERVGLVARHRVQRRDQVAGVGGIPLAVRLGAVRINADQEGGGGHDADGATTRASGTSRLMGARLDLTGGRSSEASGRRPRWPGTTERGEQQLEHLPRRGHAVDCCAPIVTPRASASSDLPTTDEGARVAAGRAADNRRCIGDQHRLECGPARPHRRGAPTRSTRDRPANRPTRRASRHRHDRARRPDKRGPACLGRCSAHERVKIDRRPTSGCASLPARNATEHTREQRQRDRESTGHVSRSNTTPTTGAAQDEQRQMQAAVPRLPAEEQAKQQNAARRHTASARSAAVAAHAPRADEALPPSGPRGDRCPRDPRARRAGRR